MVPPVRVTLIASVSSLVTIRPSRARSPCNVTRSCWWASAMGRSGTVAFAVAAPIARRCAAGGGRRAIEQRQRDPGAEQERDGLVDVASTAKRDLGCDRIDLDLAEARIRQDAGSHRSANGDHVDGDETSLSARGNIPGPAAPTADGSGT